MTEMELATMHGYARVTVPGYADKRDRQMSDRRGYIPAGTRKSDLPRLEADMALKGWGNVHRGPSPDGPVH